MPRYGSGGAGDRAGTRPVSAPGRPPRSLPASWPVSPKSPCAPGIRSPRDSCCLNWNAPTWSRGWSRRREQVQGGIEARLTEARLGLERAEQLERAGPGRGRAAGRSPGRPRHSLSAEAASSPATGGQGSRDWHRAITAIRSPIDGRVVERFAEPGDTASPGDKLLSLYNPAVSAHRSGCPGGPGAVR